MLRLTARATDLGLALAGLLCVSCGSSSSSSSGDVPPVIDSVEAADSV
jgi:hypothetical protein